MTCTVTSYIINPHYRISAPNKKIFIMAQAQGWIQIQNYWLLQAWRTSKILAWFYLINMYQVDFWILWRKFYSFLAAYARKPPPPPTPVLFWLPCISAWIGWQVVWLNWPQSAEFEPAKTTSHHLVPGLNQGTIIPDQSNMIGRFYLLVNEVAR